MDQTYLSKLSKYMCTIYNMYIYCTYIISKGAEGFGKACQDISWVYLRSMMPVDSTDSEAAHDWHGALQEPNT